MSQPEGTYDDERARRLEALLRELFHYEVRATYDTPEVAENRRIVSEALQDGDNTWEANEWKAGEDEESQW